MSKNHQNNYKSNSGKDYLIEGDHQSGYRAKDLDSGKSSVYSTDEYTGMKNHIEDVENGKSLDVDGFGKNK